MEQLIFQALGNVGVPAALCFYTLFEVNKNVKKLTDSIDRLDNDINRRFTRLEEILADLRKPIAALEEVNRRLSRIEEVVADIQKRLP